MQTIIVTSGISGSGKSTYLSKKFDGFPIVCPDDIRKEITGDVSDQSQNAKVWEIAFRKLRDYINQGADTICLSATTLSIKALHDIFKNVEKTLQRNIIVEVHCLNDSLDWEKCQLRVIKDLDNGVDRSNTDIEIDNRPLIQIMSERFVNFIKALDFEIEENVHGTASYDYSDFKNIIAVEKINVDGESRAVYDKGWYSDDYDEQRCYV